MKRKLLIGSSVLLVLLITSLAFAQGFNENTQARGPKVAPEIHEEIMDALNTGDYAAWVGVHESNDLLVRSEIANLITEENFDRFVEMHIAKQNGDMRTAKEIAEELGLERPIGKQFQKGMRQGPQDGSRKGLGGRKSGQRNFQNCPNQN